MISITHLQCKQTCYLQLIKIVDYYDAQNENKLRNHVKTYTFRCINMPVGNVRVIKGKI